MIREVIEIVRNAWAAYKTGEITLAQFLAVTRIPLKDAALTEERQ